MKKFNLFILIILSSTVYAQPRLTRLDKNSLPKTIQYAGYIVNAVRWSDNTGDNLVVATETGITRSRNKDGEGASDAALFAYHYTLQANNWKETWKVQDNIKECQEDLTASYIKNSFAVTDLDKDGKAEVWLMYKTVCHGDVSPSTLKIIMYQDGIKYAVRGSTRVKVSEKQWVGGEYAFDEAFKKAPAIFRDYALKLWKKNVVETWK